MEGDQSGARPDQARCTKNLARSQICRVLATESIVEVFLPPSCSANGCSIASALHTLVSAVIDFFRSITLKDIIDGFNRVIHAIFVEFPQLAWQGLKVLWHGIDVTLEGVFGCLYWVGYCIIWLLMFIVLYVPKRIWGIIASIAGGIARAFHELWVFISPKSMR